ncbi:MAG TPA: TIGR03435 family protein [Bryobacteraceae bacterium]|nr:TIGR03435 family protein [Bryobacteraceae bacterium]
MGGRFSNSAPLWAYIGFAYKIDGLPSEERLPAQLPKWANENYVIEAIAEGNPAKDQMRLMMRSLLADRFKLRVHFETREGPVLALTLVTPGKLGPKLRPHSEGPPCPDSFEMISPLKTPQPTGPPFLDAVRQQLGLKLARSRGELRTLIIDHVERPSEN